LEAAVKMEHFWVIFF